MEVTPALSREIFFILFWHFIALGISVYINVQFYRKGEKTALLYRYLAIQSTLIIWIISKILKTVSPTIELRWLFIVTQYLGVSFLGPLFLGFAWQYRWNRSIPKMLEIILYSIASLLFLFIASNPLHHLFYDSFTFYRDTFGHFFYVFMIFPYSLILISVFLCLSGIYRKHSSRADISIAVAAIIPFIVNILYIFRFIRPLFDVTPLYMTASLLFFGLAAFKFNFLSLLPIAREHLLTLLPDPMLFITKTGSPLWKHNFPEHSVYADEFEHQGKLYRLHNKVDSYAGVFFHYVDITRVYTLQKKLEKSTKELSTSISIIQKKNKNRIHQIEKQLLDSLRRRLHDILGHSLTMCLCALRSAKKQPEHEKAIRSLLKKQLTDAIKDLQQENGELEHLEASQVLSIRLQELIEQTELLNFDLFVHIYGEEKPLVSQKTAQLVQCVKEAITNALKHGQANRIDISLAYRKKTLTLIISDNGKGCSNLIMGNGLTLMNKELNTMGAECRIASDEGDGFQLTIILPLEQSRDRS